MPRRFRRRLIAGGQRRETMWISVSPTSSTLASANTAVLSNSLNATAKALRPFTVIRSRLFLHVRSDQQAAVEFYGIAMGLAVVSDQAVAIGVTAVPTPDTDRGSDLFFVFEDLWGVQFDVATASGNEFGKSVIVDSKAMRKVNDDQDIVITSETIGLSSGAIVSVGGRLLLKLH